MESCGKYFVDEKGRLVRKVAFGVRERRYYVGTNIHGFIEVDGGGEYIMVQNEKRYWRGVFVPSPDKLLLLQDFNLCILKPDCGERGLVQEIKSIIADSFKVLDERSVILDKQKTFRLYPYFFEENWEHCLLEYLTSGPSLCLLVSGPDIFRKLPITRNRIRFKYKDEKKRHPVFNLVHCADSKEDAVRESLIFFGQKELVTKIGFSE